MKIASIKALFHKEISDIFRDKKTLFMMVVIPLILYPLLIIGMTLLMSSIMSNQVETVYKVALENVPDAEGMEALLSDEEQDFTYKLEIVKVSDAKAALNEGKIDAYATYKGDKTEGFVTDENGIVSLEGKLQIVYYDAKDESSMAEQGLEELLNAYQDELRKENLLKLQMDEKQMLYPLSYSVVGLSSNEETMGNIMGSAIPMMIIVSILMGAIYPAIDVTAGEKERGTLETLLTLPVTNFEMIMSKFLAVSVIAGISAVLNIVSMGAACGFMVSFMTADANGGGSGLQVNLSNFIPAILLTIIVMVAFALFVTAVCMCVCVFAKSFKEANNYVTPVMLIFMFGGFAAMIPNLELTATTAAIPIINVALLIEQLFSFQYDYALFGIVFLTNVIYSLLTVMVLGKIYNSEEVLFSESLSSVKMIKNRKDMKQGQMPGYGDVILLSSVVMLFILYLGTFAQVKFGFGGVIVTQSIILILPVCYAWYMKTDFVKLFSMHRPKISQVAGAFITWAGGFSLILLISMLLTPLFHESAINVETAFTEFVKLPVLLLVFVIALMPAVGEELMFRGFIFGTLREKTKGIRAMLIVSALFGIYHMSLIKFFTTALLGFILVYVVSETKSIFCSMLMHFCNNLVSVIAMKYPDEVGTFFPILTKEQYQISDYLLLALMAALGLGIGIWLCRKKGKKN